MLLITYGKVVLRPDEPKIYVFNKFLAHFERLSFYMLSMFLILARFLCAALPPYQRTFNLSCVPSNAMAVRLFIAHFIRPKPPKYSYSWHRFRWQAHVFVNVCVCVREWVSERANDRTRNPSIHQSKASGNVCSFCHRPIAFLKEEIIIKINGDIFIVMDSMC